MITTTAVLNEPVHGYLYISTASMEFLSGWEVYKDGVLLVAASNIVVNRTDPNGPFVMRFIPTSTGKYYIIMNDQEVMYVEVTTRSLQGMLKNIEDEALGSWTWNKTTGGLNLLKQDGSPLASFDVVDTQLTASRERTA